MQILWQNWTMKYCDNGGCNRRRVVSAKRSNDGVHWAADLPLLTPDQTDRPELQFYRMRPFYISNTSRIAAHTLQYAPAPPQRIVGNAPPGMCIGKSGALFHGPHLYEEWWVGPASGDASDIKGCKSYLMSHHSHICQNLPNSHTNIYMLTTT